MIKTTPMIFNSEMVRALLAGNKTQTRRIIKHQPFVSDVFPSLVFPKNKKELEEGAGLFYPNAKSSVLAMCPFGQADDLIYVRETFAYQTGDDNEPLNPQVYLYAETDSWDGIRVPSIHMPRRVSRLTLKITSVRVERIQDISEEDAKKEGVSFLRDVPDCDETLTEKQLFGFLWDSVYPKSWSKNQWVWVVDFEVIHKNIDQVLAEMEQAA
tara:strand:- start:1127 stop:1762 length:636 start_codon:yes stop_codon:yes gene_type:complete